MSRLSDVAPVRFNGFDYSTQQSDGAVELQWCVRGKLTRFGVHVVPRNFGLLVSHPDLKGFGAKPELGPERDFEPPMGLCWTSPRTWLLSGISGGLAAVDIPG